MGSIKSSKPGPWLVLAASASFLVAGCTDGDNAPVTDTLPATEVVTSTATATALVTPWGRFLINPVLDGKSAINPQGLPYPVINGAGTRSVEASNEDQVRAARDAGIRVIEIPERFRQGMQLQGMEAKDGGNQFIFDIAYSSGRDTPDLRSIRLTAFTPTAAVPFEVFPGHPVIDFAATFEVNGNPTLTVLPGAATDPRDERVIAWSQGTAVYYLRTTGLFDTSAVIELAREISRTESAR